MLSGSQSSEASREESTLSTTTVMAFPVELTHLFLNKDGTLDSSRLFRTQNRAEGISLMESASEDSDQLLSAMTESSVFLSKNNTQFAAHSGSTVILPCSVHKESKFEMVIVVLIMICVHFHSF